MTKRTVKTTRKRRKRAPTTPQGESIASSLSLFRFEDYVEIKDLMNSSIYNGSFGAVVSDEYLKENGRYSVQVRKKDESNDEKKKKTKTKMLSIRPKNLNKFITLEEGEEEVEEEGEEGAGGKPLRKSWYFGYFASTELLGGTIIYGNNVDGCTAILNYNMWGRTVTGSDETTNVHCTWANLLFYAGMASLTERISSYGPDIMKKVVEACTSDNVNDFRAIVYRVKNLLYGLFLRTKSRSFRPNTTWMFLRKFRKTRCARKFLRLIVLVKIVTMW
ncbi:hypothetical protein FRACYDRAFT_235003 [Fragilariopsis cylindrus CCMP1102]|uniref:Uncharacterized protein n=1 Tax=Fragilariopsis cylindrus CCMP1102 TaxID=635003 RepID=A0A1E7FTA0_9STRA|nr:hypothetical protein FRACYDRAFT_235003 [Fragilariopsis cylindrus CCMP1102]|eukprot:OEU21379.1 hypothetical protein FRACYDRAFT_235003 [Fragilariopsis cylindrus CCMP1102]